MNSSKKFAVGHASTVWPTRIIEFIIYNWTVAPSFWKIIRFNV
jgi:hypothetical protein